MLLENEQDILNFYASKAEELSTSTEKTGVKYDEDKPNVAWLLEYFPRALYEISKVSDFGAKKYTKGGWSTVKKGEERYTSALLRHFLDIHIQGDYDKESNLLHLAHIAWNALAILELKLKSFQK